jgi:outer membrane receptor protein involved in Fe transport
MMSNRNRKAAVGSRSELSPAMHRASALLALVVGMVMFGGLPPALAQSEDNLSDDERLALEDVVVTVRRIEEIETAVPLSTSVIGDEDIVRQGLTGLDDVVALIPGVTYDLGGFPNDTRPAVRGMQAERGRPSVAVMLDGLDLSGENLAISGGGAGVVPDLMDLERIEVVKGPQTTLYGRNAFAGAINYIAKKPSDALEGRLTLEAAEYGQRRFEGMISGPIVDGLLGYRINAAVREGDGFWTNPVNGGPLGAEEFEGIAGALRFTPGVNWDINLRYRVSSTDNSDYPTAQIPANTRLPVPGGTFTAGPPGSPSLPCPGDLSGQPAPVFEACTRGTILGPIRAGIGDVQMGLNEETGEPPRGLELDQQILSLDAKWTTGFGTLRYTLGWIDNDSFIEADGDFTDYDAPPGFVFSLSALQQLDYANERVDHNLYWTHELGNVRLLLGAQYLEEDSTLVTAPASGSATRIRRSADPRFSWRPSRSRPTFRCASDETRTTARHTAA